MPTAEQLLAALPGTADIHNADEVLGLMDNVRAALACLVPSAEEVRVSVGRTTVRVSYPSFTDAATRAAIEEVCRLFVCHKLDETNQRYNSYIRQNSLPPNPDGATVGGVHFSTHLWQKTLGKMEMLTCAHYTPSASVRAAREKKLLLNEVNDTLNGAQRPSPRKV